MLKVTQLTVRSFNLVNLDLFWEIAPVVGVEGQPHAIYEYDFVVLRSEAALGPYAPVSNPLRDTYRFRDTQVSLLNKHREFYYKIRVLHVPTGKFEDFGPTASGDAPPDLIAADIIRQEDLLFREFVGRRCWLYPVRTFGPTCTCFDPFMGRRSKSNCATCYGTGWLGGYMSPAECWVQIQPEGKNEQNTQLMQQQPGDTQGTMISFPPVKPKDILIESENRRWRVVAVTPTERLRSVVRQVLQLHEVPKGDPVYALPVNVDLKNLTPAAERNFTNPQNVDHADYSDILAAYGHGRRLP